MTTEEVIWKKWPEEKPDRRAIYIYSFGKGQESGVTDWDTEYEMWGIDYNPYTTKEIWWTEWNIRMVEEGIPQLV